MSTVVLFCLEGSPVPPSCQNGFNSRGCCPGLSKHRNWRIRVWDERYSVGIYSTASNVRGQCTLLSVHTYHMYRVHTVLLSIHIYIYISYASIVCTL